MRPAVAREFLGAAVRAKRPPKRLPRQALPVGLEHKYFKLIRDLLRAYRYRVKDRLSHALPRLLERAQEKIHRRDAEADVIEALFNELEVYIGDIFDPDTLKRELVDIGGAAEQFNAAQMNGQVREVLGVDVVGDEPWLDEVLQAFAAENASLITSTAEQWHDEIAQATVRAVRQGTSAGDLADFLEDRFEVAESRAAFIARDQISKLNGDLTKARQTDLGVTGYVWRTSGDERVRPEHRALNGRKFSWDDPPEVGHPGQDYNCRCTAEPDFSTLADDE